MSILELPEYIMDCLNTLERAGFEAWLVGGCIRDLRAGKAPQDYDIATSAHPNAVLHLFPRVAETGLQYGTVTVLYDAGQAEVTTFRRDGAYRDSRHPENVAFTASIQDDLSRRDFTINAMAYSPTRGFYDPFLGLEDYRRQCIRAVGEPAVRFQEDALRILRCIRFAAQLGFVIEPRTYDALLSLLPTLQNISVERIAAEFLKIITAAHPEALEPLLAKEGLHCVGITAAARLEKLKQLPSHTALRLAAFALLADLTPQTLSRKLKLSHKLRDQSGSLYAMLIVPLPQTPVDLKRRFAVLPPAEWEDLLQARSVLLEEETGAVRNMLQVIVARDEPWRLSQLAIRGEDVLRAGITEPKKVGEALRQCLELVMESPALNQRDTLMKRLISGSERTH